MRFFIVAAALTLSATVSAQRIGDLPTCPKDCITEAASAGGCDPVDPAPSCFCGNRPFNEGITQCFKPCADDDEVAGWTTLNRLCRSAGLTSVGVPDATGGSGGSNPSPSSSSSPAPATTTPSDAASHVGYGLGFVIAAAGLPLALI